MSATPTISVRRLDANHDPVYGGGRDSFLVDIYAVAQLIDTTLLLLQGEWWANLDAGFPLFQRVIGIQGIGNSPQIAALIIQQTILGVPYVTGMSDAALKYDPLTRTFSYFAIVYTQFGTVQTTFIPGSSASMPTKMVSV
jgi:hypothetical protein